MVNIILGWVTTFSNVLEGASTFVSYGLNSWWKVYILATPNWTNNQVPRHTHALLNIVYEPAGMFIDTQARC